MTGRKTGSLLIGLGFGLLLALAAILEVLLSLYRSAFIADYGWDRVFVIVPVVLLITGLALVLRRPKPQADWFVPLYGIVFLFFAAVGVVMLVWPSMLLRLVRNPLQPDTPLNRVYTRSVGFLFCLFVLVAVSGAFEGFHKNILIALSLSPVILPILWWILWRYSPLQRVNRRYLVDRTEDPRWELQVSVAFCSLLFILAASALLLAMRGIYLK